MFQIELYETAEGKQPVSDFLDSLDTKMAAKMIGLLEILEEKGIKLRMPYSEHIDDGIFELRCKVGNNITRALYFFYFGNIIVITNCFIKKTNKTPVKEIKLAKRRRTDWIRRQKERRDD